MTPPRPVTAIFAVALTVFGIAQAVYLQAGEDTYRDLTRGRGQATLPVQDVTWHIDESVLADVHRQTLAYLLDRVAEPPKCCDGRPVFDADERAHLADVRGVFRALGIANVVAGLVLLVLLIRARRGRYMLRLARDGAMWSGAVVVLVAVIAAVAFEPAFLAFHYLFFPQGNFLFDPATSNLLRVYPQSYWYGVTIRVGLTFIGAMAALVVLASVAQRARRALTTAAR